MNPNPDAAPLKNLRIAGLCGGFLLAGFLIGMLFFGAPWHLKPAWGDAATWVLVLLGGIGGGAALRQLILQQEQINTQAAVLAREASDRRRAQASRVFLWTEEEADRTLTQAQLASLGTGPGTVIVAHIKNSSQQPVYDLEVTWHQGAALRGSVEGHGVALPDAKIDARKRLTSGPSAAVSGSPFRVTLQFRDAAGVRWQVDQDGKLEESAPNS